MEEEETDDVGSKTERANDENEFGMGNFLRFDKSLDGFEKDGKTESDEEYAVDESTERLSALPLSAVSTI